MNTPANREELEQRIATLEEWKRQVKAAMLPILEDWMDLASPPTSKSADLV